MPTSLKGDDYLRNILDANEVYASAFAQSDPKLLMKLAKGQSPRIFWLGCSDSRVSAELSTGVAPGSIFVHRNIANSFSVNDQSAMAALTYAVNVLKVDSIIVCGHTGCGGVKAAMDTAEAEKKSGGPIAPKNTHETIVYNWIKPIKDLALAQLDADPASLPPKQEDPSLAEDVAAIAHLADTHVANTVKAIAESSIVQDAWKEGRKLSVHGWVYHVKTAKLRDLDVGWSVDQKAESLSRKTTYADSEYSEHLRNLVDSDDEK